MVAVFGLDGHGQADLLSRFPGFFQRVDQLPLRHGHAASTEQRLR